MNRDIDSFQEKQTFKPFILNRIFKQSYRVLVVPLILCFLIVSGLTQTLTSQSLQSGDPIERYLRFIPEQVVLGQSSWNIRPIVLADTSSLGLNQLSHPWQMHPYFRDAYPLSEPISGISLYVPSYTFTYNHDFPFGQNDGALWQGKGINYISSLGIGFYKSGFRAAFRPAITYSENDRFRASRVPTHEGLNELAQPLTFADMPQRFGVDSFHKMDLGDSFIRYERDYWMAGISNERLWTGPAIYQPLILSNNAPGFTHLFLSTHKPVITRYGAFESRIFWGSLLESDFFDENPSNDRRFATGLVLNFQPAKVPGLHLGLTRTAYSNYPNDGLGFREATLLFRRPVERPDLSEEIENIDKYRVVMTSYFFRWVLADTGMEVYGEWGRNDYQRARRDFFAEPELNRAWVLGVQKRFHLPGNSRLILNAEMTQLENSSTSSQYRENNVWYADPLIPQGFTNRGQVLGASIGPGSSAQLINLSFYNRFGMIGTSVSRTVYQNDRLYNQQDYYRSIQLGIWDTLRKLHHVEMRNDIHLLLFLPWNLELQADIHLSSIENQYNVINRDVTNANLMFTLRYHMPGFIR